MSIQAYQQDWNYKELWDTRYEQYEASKIVNKLVRHFKLGKVQVRFDKNICGSAYTFWNMIRLPRKNIALQMICHELGHLLACKKYGTLKRPHCKKAYTQIHRICKYAYRYVDMKYKSLVVYDTNKSLVEVK